MPAKKNHRYQITGNKRRSNKKERYVLTSSLACVHAKGMSIHENKHKVIKTASGKYSKGLRT